MLITQVEMKDVTSVLNIEYALMIKCLEEDKTAST